MTLFIVGFIIIVLFLSYKLWPVAEKSGNVAIIQNWVLHSSKSEKINKIIGQSTPPRPPKNMVIEKPIEIKNVEQFQKDGNKILADSMFDCWDAFNRGKTDFLENYKWNVFVGAKPFCFHCATIEFDDSLVGKNYDFEDPKLQEKILQDYLKTEKPQGFDNTYLELLAGNFIVETKIPDDGNMYIYFIGIPEDLADRYIQTWSEPGMTLDTFKDAGIGLGVGFVGGGIKGGLLFGIGGLYLPHFKPLVKRTFHQEVVAAPIEKIIPACNPP